MAIRRRQEVKIYPIDTQKSVAVGLRIPFNAVGIFGQNYTTAEQVKSNLINFMLTNEGERPFNNQFGANLRAIIFQSTNSVEEIKEIILDKINLYFPQVDNKNLTLTKAEDSDIIYASLKYSFNKQEDSLFIGIAN
jgi:phage baseplate assembly protein W